MTAGATCQLQPQHQTEDFRHSTSCNFTLYLFSRLHNNSEILCEYPFLQCFPLASHRIVQPSAFLPPWLPTTNLPTRAPTMTPTLAYLRCKSNDLFYRYKKSVFAPKEEGPDTPVAENGPR